MTEIIAISDNHGERKCLSYIKEKHINADYFFHLGDSVLPSYLLDGFAVVQGNNDPYKEYPNHLIIELEGHHILLIHGHNQLYYGDLQLLHSLALNNNCDIVFFGHTHLYFDKTYKGIRFLNPGSIIRNRDGSIGSYMRILIDDKDINVEHLTYEKVLK